MGIYVFSRMRSKGSRFTLGVWGLRVCSLDVAFLFATVRNRSCDPRMAVPMVSSAGGVIFGCFQRFDASFRVAGVALCDIQTCFVTCRKSFCVAGTILLRRFPKMRGSFRGRRSTLEASHRHFAWQAQHFRRVALHVFCKSHWQGCVMATRCKFRGRRGILWHVLKIDGSLARNIDFEVAKLQVPEKTRRKTSILMLQSVKSGGSLVRNARFDAPTCLVSSLWLSRGFAVSMGEAAKPVLLSCCQLWKLPEVSRKMFVLMLPRVSSRVSGFPVASPCLWGKLQNLSLFGGFQAGCHVVLRGRRGTLWHSNLFDNVPKVSLVF